MKTIINGVAARRMLRPVMILAAGLAAGSATAATASAALPAQSASSMCAGANVAAFGPNVCVFNDTMSQASIQTDLNNIASQQVSNQFGSQRFAIFFEPGTYGSATHPLIFQVGYYTSVAGLGLSPGDVVVNGSINVYNQCFGSNSNCIALVNFWRSLSNLTINVTGNKPGGNGCSANTDFWAVSQASPIRRVQVNGLLSLMDYCDGSPDFASGGFIADSAFTGKAVINGSQQQWVTRNSNLVGWSNSVWNQVFCGTNGAPDQNFNVNGGKYSTLATCPVTEEEPFLYTDAQGNFNVFVPAVRHDSVGPAWVSGTEAGTSIPLSKFFVASPGMSGSAMTSAMARGLNLILTPGVYNLNQQIVVPHPDTVVLGLGMATLVPQQGNAAMKVVSNNGVRVSGLIIDAGPVNSPVLLTVGTPGPSSAGDPDSIQDVFFRIGGAATTPVSATVSLLDNAGNSIIDDVWAWRADHGNAVGWTVNQGDTGVEVTGDNVTAYGLFTEHFQKNEVIWSGQGGTDIFFQNEMPYDPPSQSAWMASPTQDGYPALLVTSGGTGFQGWGMGSYSFFNQGVNIYSAMAFQSTTSGVSFHDLLTIFLSKAGFGGIQSVINGVGGSSTIANPDTPVTVVSYP